MEVTRKEMEVKGGMGEILGRMGAVMDAGWSEEGMYLGPDWAGGGGRRGKQQGKGEGKGTRQLGRFIFLLLFVAKVPHRRGPKQIGVR